MPRDLAPAVPPYAYFLDCETDGLRPTSRVLSIGLREMRDGVPTDRAWEGFFNGGITGSKNLDPHQEDAFEITGFDPDVVASWPDFAEAVESMLTFLGPAPVLVGYHLERFDLPWLQNEMMLAGHAPLAVSGAIDTVLLSTLAWTDEDMCALRDQALAETGSPQQASRMVGHDFDAQLARLGVDAQALGIKRHTASGDALLGAHAFLPLMQRVEARFGQAARGMAAE